MDYQFEVLGDERFQELCHSLFSKRFQNSQAFPVGQRDGGRDSIGYYLDKNVKKFAVSQVKFVRNAHKIIDVHKWFVETISEEIPKIKKLIPRGATSYYILTNVPGTAFPDSGSIDKVNKYLEDNLNIPAICWWRDDLARMFEEDNLLKWSYPEIINGQDMLNKVLFDYVQEDRERRKNTIRGYLSDQYEIERVVKFKQIELRNELLDLYVDVPVQPKETPRSKNQEKLFRLFESIKRNAGKDVGDSPFGHPHRTEENKYLGTATFLLDQRVQNNSKVLLEGGPGQGKSTITQYICQVNRIKLLGKTEDIQKLPSNLVDTSVRLPIKIDLRDLASWIDRKNPYSTTLNGSYFESNWVRSLEGFIVAHIAYHSSFLDFTVSDLMAVCKSSPLLIVFDGFDEIADIKIRKEIIEIINRGINKLSSNGVSVQVIVTSRPSAVAGDTTFSEEDFPHFELGAVNENIIKDYLEKWIYCRNFSQREGKDLQRVVHEKLRLPHLRELAKSPMQLAILISLISIRGESLPNKRTELYDSYIELFFNRESEKNTVVRDNRDLIINIHRYLGWILHSEAETQHTNGRITQENLIQHLEDYLVNQGHQVSIAESLFSVVQERVCAIVSRVQGIYEFEVQPLREYFCAKYLYTTSPYCPVGQSMPGTKPERFHYLVRSPYWQNVVRFFAGCFDQGELPMLIDKLSELNEEAPFAYTNHARIITSQLLADWVFSQYPRLLDRVVQIILKGLRIKYIISNSAYSNETIIIPEKCGREQIVSECFRLLRTFPSVEYAKELIELINNNPYKKEFLWRNEIGSLEKDSLTLWIQYGYHLRLLHTLDQQELSDIINSDSHCDPSRIQYILRSGRFDVLDSEIQLKRVALQSMINNENRIGSHRQQNNHPLRLLAMWITPVLYSYSVFSGTRSITFKGIISDYSRMPDSIDPISENYAAPKDECDQQILDFHDEVKILLETDLNSWRTSLINWETLVVAGERNFGSGWLFKVIAVIGAGVKSATEKDFQADSLDDERLSLCKRMRIGRLKSGNPSFWKSQLTSSISNQLVIFCMLTWATPRTISENIELLESCIDNLPLEQSSQIVSALMNSCRCSLFNSTQKSQAVDLLKRRKCSDIVFYALALRIEDFLSTKAVIAKYTEVVTVHHDIEVFILNNVIFSCFDNTLTEKNLSLIRSLYSKCKHIYDYDHSYSFRRYQNRINVGYKLAQVVMGNSAEYPLHIVANAERTCHTTAYGKGIHIGQVARSEGWFFDV